MSADRIKLLSQSHKFGISFGSSGTYGEKNEILNTLKLCALLRTVWRHNLYIRLLDRSAVAQNQNHKV